MAIQIWYRDTAPSTVSIPAVYAIPRVACEVFDVPDAWVQNGVLFLGRHRRWRRWRRMVERAIPLDRVAGWEVAEPNSQPSEIPAPLPLSVHVFAVTEIRTP